MDLIELERMRVATSRADLALADGEAVLSGGTWLFSEPQPGLRGLVDLTGLGWTPMEDRPDGGLSIAATCTLSELASHPHPLFATCVDALLGSWKIHRAATVGGNVCLALPAGPMISLATVLDGIALIWAPDGGERRLPVVEFVRGVRDTALAPGEVLRAIELPPDALRARTATRRASLAPLGRSGVFVLARRDADGGFVLAVTASTPRPHRLAFARLPTAVELATAVDAIGDWYDDAHGAPDWRRAMTLRFAEELRAELA